MLWLTLALLASLTQDPRVGLVERQLEGELQAALAETERLLSRVPRSEDELGLYYLRANLLDRLGRRKEAVEAYVKAMSANPALRPYARFHVAVNQELLGHPEVAAGLVATLLGSRPPAPLLSPATRLLARSLANGGDCRLLTGLSSREFPRPHRRLLELMRGDCALRTGDPDAARNILLSLLEEEQQDLTARQAAERMATMRDSGDHDLDVLLGLTFHSHREFQRSARYLQGVVDADPTTVDRGLEFEAHYRFVRSHFWQSRFEEAALGFGQLAERTRGRQEKAQALYHQGRSYELLGNWHDAAVSHRQCYEADPDGRWASAALISMMRLLWRQGQEEAALHLLDQLASRRSWRFELERAALFLASSDIVRGRSDRADSWLEQAARANPKNRTEIAYWRGRLAELEGDREKALEQYLRALRHEPYHPLAREGRRRLFSESLTQTTESRARRLAGSQDLDDLLSAWALLGRSHSLSGRLYRAISERLSHDHAAAPFLNLAFVPPVEWPIWHKTLDEPEELLLALGVWEEGAPTVTRHFPIAQPDLAFTASFHLASAGETRRALLMVEIMSKRIPDRVPAEFLPLDFRRLLYPRRYQTRLEEAAGRHGIDTHLLAALIREESRFDPSAVSSAAARGLAQFVYPTAQRIARKIGLGAVSPRDLEDPGLSIELGAAYLGELNDRFRGALHQVVAAYNAGEPQSVLWQSYCYSRALDEYYTKVAFRETRNYLRKVLSTRAHYAAIYPDSPDDAGILARHRE